MKVATLFATLFTAVNAFAPSTPLSTNVRSGSSLVSSMLSLDKAHLIIYVGTY